MIGVGILGAIESRKFLSIFWASACCMCSLTSYRLAAIGFPFLPGADLECIEEPLENNRVRYVCDRFSSDAAVTIIFEGDEGGRFVQLKSYTIEGFDDNDTSDDN